uniref:PDZ domain-containing protein n=1 Tax=Salarias fasciatus TaxID=181472 RepID=A0A672GIU9_SALFA
TNTIYSNYECIFTLITIYTFFSLFLQHRFGFVLRGAKDPIEEFAPTPAFPALQYLESVDQGGVAWRAGLRTGDFLIEVTAEHGAGVRGHRQVVSLIRQGGSRLLMKVVSVSRKSESNLIRKKAPPPPKRAPSTSLTLRSKSMTSDPLSPCVSCGVCGMMS